MRRCAILTLLCLVLAAPAFAAAGKTSWAQREILAVTARGLMGGKAASFQPDAPLTQAALADLVAGLTNRPAASTAEPAAPVTTAKLDAKLVSALGLGSDAAAFATAAGAAGLAPPTRFGSEVVARLLGLRTNHPTGQDALERLPNDTTTRAEAAFSAAQILGFGDWELQSLDDDAQSFEVPELTPWQRRILRVAVSFIGYPYVWGGTSENAQTPLGFSTPGGFDCSGFVWRVFKLQAYAGAPRLSGVLRGRTTMAMSGEVAKSARVAIDELEPADVVFFGSRGPKSKPAQVDHTILESHILVDVLVVELKRRGQRRVENLDGLGQHLDLAGPEIGVHRTFRPWPHFAFDADDEFIAQTIGMREGVGRVGIAHHLHEALAISQVDEDHAAMVTPAMHPSEQRHSLAEIPLVDQSTIVSAHDSENDRKQFGLGTLGRRALSTAGRGVIAGSALRTRHGDTHRDHVFQGVLHVHVQLDHLRARHDQKIA